MYVAKPHIRIRPRPRRRYIYMHHQQQLQISSNRQELAGALIIACLPSPDMAPRRPGKPRQQRQKPQQAEAVLGVSPFVTTPELNNCWSLFMCPALIPRSTGHGLNGLNAQFTLSQFITLRPNRAVRLNHLDTALAGFQRRTMPNGISPFKAVKKQCEKLQQFQTNAIYFIFSF